MPLVSQASVGSGSGSVGFSNTPAGTTTAAAATANTTGVYAAAAAAAASSLAASTAGVATVITGSNLGSGHGLFVANSTSGGRSLLNFKSLLPGNNVTITEDALTITINATATGGSGASRFTALLDAPNTIVPNAVLIGSNNALRWSPVPTGANQALVFNGTNLGFAALPTGTVTSVGLSGTADITVSSTPITGIGLLSVALAPTGVTAGTYTSASIVVDANGRIKLAQSGSATTITGINGVTASVSGGTYSVALAATGVTAGSYGFANVTVDAFGRISAISANNPFTSITTLGGGTALATVVGSVLSVRTLTPGNNVSFANGTDGALIINATAPANGVSLVAATGDNAISVANSPITSTGTLTISLLPSGVIPGTYGTVVVDAQGRVLMGAAASGGSGSGSVALAGDATGMGLLNGTIPVVLAASGVTVGTYAKVSVDSKGRVIAGATLALGDVTAALGFTPVANAITSLVVTPGTGITVAGSPITMTGTLTIGLAATGASPGTYGQFAVDATGRVTAARALSSSDVVNALGYTPASSATSGVTSVSITSVNGGGVNVSGGPITSSGTFTVGLSLVAGAAGTYNNLIIDAYGRVASARSLNSSDIIGALGYTPPTPGNYVISALAGNGIAVSPTSGNVTVSLTTTGVAVGTYSRATVAVDAYGRITAISSNAASSGVTSVSAAGSNGVTVTGGPITTTGSFAISLVNTSVVPGTYALATVAVDATGRITSASVGTALAAAVNLPSAFATGAPGSNSAFLLQSTSAGTIGFSVLAGSGNVNVSGGQNGNTNIVLDLTTTGVSPGTYEKVVVDANGRVLSGSQLTAQDINTALGYTAGNAANSGGGGGGGGQTSTVTDATVPHFYTFQAAFDASGNLTTSPFSGQSANAAGWTLSRDGANQVTVVHNLGLLPTSVAFFGEKNGSFTMKPSTGNITSQFSIGMPSTNGISPNQFTIYGLSATSTNSNVSSYVVVKVLI